MIATITLNPSLDITITVDGLVVDETNRWTHSRLYAGGKGIDVSRAIHEMGGRTVAYGFIGGSPGRQVEILLDKEGVPFSFTPIEHETRANFIITDTKTSQQTRIDAPGPRISKEQFSRFHRKIMQIYPKPNLVVVGGSVPPGLPVNIYYDIIRDAKDFKVRCHRVTADSKNRGPFREVDEITHLRRRQSEQTTKDIRSADSREVAGISEDNCFYQIRKQFFR